MAMGETTYNLLIFSRNKSVRKSNWAAFMHPVFYGRCPAYLIATLLTVNAHLGQRLRSTSSTDFSLYRSYAPSLESALSRMPVSLHGTHCPNTSVLCLTFAFLGNCWRHIFLTIAF